MLEALQAGTAVVASACDGLPEDLTHEVDGLLIEPGNTAALAAALGRLLADPALRSRLAEAARRTYQARFTPQGFVSALTEVYDELLAAGAPTTDAARISFAT